MIGIYAILNLVNNKIYIGESVSIKSRWTNHKFELRHNKHINKHLQQSWNKYGENNFEFKVIEECKKEELAEKEIYWIKFYNAINSDYGYNNTIGGEGANLIGELNPFYGKKHSEEAKKKFRARTGKNNHFTGKKHSEETKKEMSEKAKGRKMFQEHKERLIKMHKGKSLSEETKRKISASLKNKVYNVKIHFTEDEEKQIIELRKSGYTLKQIQDKFGLKNDYPIKRILKKYNIGKEYNCRRQNNSNESKIKIGNGNKNTNKNKIKDRLKNINISIDKIKGLKFGNHAIIPSIQQIYKIIELRKEGYSISDITIALEFKNASTVSSILKKLDIV